MAGTTGSEDGKILFDEEYKNACRITMEKCEEYYAITCGIYGGMIHTCFCGADNYRNIYDDMKKDLQKFIDNEAFMDEDTFCGEFTSKY